jgi:hypothetical protein
LTGSGRSATVGGWFDAGTFTINPDADTIDFTVVPEPSTFGLLTFGGLLVLSFRHRFNRKNY